MRKRTHDEFVVKLYEEHGDEYQAKGRYENSSTKIEIYHTVCDSSYLVRPSNILRGDKCSKCYGNRRKTHEVFTKEVSELVGNEYTVLEKYKNANTKIKMKHNKCGCVYPVTPSKFLLGRRCPDCAGNQKLSHDDFLKRVYEVVSEDEYTIIGRYINRKTHLVFIHNRCDYHWRAEPSVFLKLRGECPFCNNNLRQVDEKTFSLRLKQVHGDEYTLEGEYTHQKKVKLKHTVCGNVYLVDPSSVLQGVGCRECSIKRVSGYRRTSQSDVIDMYKEKNFVLYNPEHYENNKTKMKCYCVNHPEITQEIGIYNLRGTDTPCVHCREDKNLSSLNKRLRKCAMNWRALPEKECSYKCALSESEEYEVHHLYSFGGIILDSLRSLGLDIKQDYTSEEYILIRKEVRLRHDEGILGVCIHPLLHKEFHRIYTKENNTPEQFEEFKQRYNNGEFDGVLDI